MFRVRVTIVKHFAKYLYLILFVLILVLPDTSIAAEGQCVILLHGLARSHHTMSKLESTLNQYHYIVVNKDYPSTTKSIKELANENIKSMIDECFKKNATQINFVTHSLGGIVLQVYLQNHNIAKLGRIVMLSPPNHGSRITDLLCNNWLYRFITGPAGQELATNKSSTPNRILLSSKYSIGIIAGNFNFIPFGNDIFQEPNDGAVSVSSTKTKIMKDFIELPVSHPFMMDNKTVQFEVVNFLKFGKFKHIIYVKNH